MLVEHRAIAEDVRSRNADEASFDEHVKAMTGGGQHPVINRPVLIPDFRDGEALDLGANRRTSAKGREAGLQGSARERTGVRRGRAKKRCSRAYALAAGRRGWVCWRFRFSFGEGLRRPSSPG